MSEPQLTEVFDLLAQLGIAVGVAPIKGKVWEYDVDDNWKVAINATEQGVTVEPKGGMNVGVRPYECAVWWNGWLAGTVTPFDGVLVAHPEGANEAALLAAMRKRITELEASR